MPLRALFLALGQVHRTTFVLQSANLWTLKECVWCLRDRLLRYDPLVAMVDSVQVRVCRFARAHRSF